MAAPGPATPAGDGSTAALNAGIAVAAITLLAVIGPVLGLSPWIIALAAGGALTALSLDAWRYGGRGGHLLAEALPGGAARLRRIALHEAGHALAADHDQLPVRRVLVGSLACLRQGLSANGSTEFELPAHAKLPAEELRRWSRVLLAGMVAEELIYGESEGGSDDRALLGRIWGLSGFDVATAQLEQRRARREVEQALSRCRLELEQRSESLLAEAPRLFRQASSRPAGEIIQNEPLKSEPIKGEPLKNEPSKNELNP